MKGKIFLVAVILMICTGFSFFVAHYWQGTDFPVFYRTAYIILDPNTPNELVYSNNNFDKYAIPEHTHAISYIFSMAAAYILAPLALMPYYTAKTFFIAINIMAYLAAIVVVLHLSKASGRWFYYPMILSIFWLPFIANINFGQVNAILLLLVTLAVLAATKNRPECAGTLLGLAALFKLFPFAIAMVIGLKNWRIFAACFATVALSFLIPGSAQWFSAIQNINNVGYTELYRYINHFGSAWFVLCTITISCLTAVIAYCAKYADYILLASFAIPAMFLATPIVEYHHFTLLIFAYVYLSASAKKNKFMLFLLFLSILTMYQPIHSALVSIIQIAGLFILWLVAALQLYRSRIM